MPQNAAGPALCALWESLRVAALMAHKNGKIWSMLAGSATHLWPGAVNTGLENARWSPSTVAVFLATSRTPHHTMRLETDTPGTRNGYDSSKWRGIGLRESLMLDGDATHLEWLMSRLLRGIISRQDAVFDAIPDATKMRCRRSWIWSATSEKRSWKTRARWRCSSRPWPRHIKSCWFCALDLTFLDAKLERYYQD